jgi:hypothetical protein
MKREKGFTQPSPSLHDNDCSYVTLGNWQELADYEHDDSFEAMEMTSSFLPLPVIWFRRVDEMYFSFHVLWQVMDVKQKP